MKEYGFHQVKHVHMYRPQARGPVINHGNAGNQTKLFALSGREPVRNATRACSVWLGKPHRSGSLHGAMDCCCLAGGTRHITRRAWNRALRTEELTQKFHQNSRNFRGILRNFRGASRGLPCGSPPLSLLIVALAGPFVWLPALP